MNINLNKYQITPHRGFLPPSDPLKSLPSYFQPLEEIALSLPELLKEGKLKEKIQNLPLLSIESLQTIAECERAMILFGYISHGFVRGEESNSDFIPSSLAIPWVQLAGKLERNPILSHASLVLNNWQRIAENGKLVADNMKALVQLTEYPDESWFYVATTEVEVSGAGIPALLLQLLTAAQKTEIETLNNGLSELEAMIQAMHHSLSRMRIGCRPEIFYHKIRPFLASFENIKYEGVKNPVRSYYGGSAGQSSLLQSIDAVLGIEHSESQAGGYLKEMLNYMPLSHANFIRDLQKSSNIKSLCQRENSLKELYQNCVQAVLNIRNEHLKIVSEYIIAQASGPAVGTGGTSPLTFLKQVRNDTGKNK